MVNVCAVFMNHSLLDRRRSRRRKYGFGGTLTEKIVIARLINECMELISARVALLE